MKIIPTTVVPIIPDSSSIDEKIKEISSRIKTIKMFSEDKKYLEVINNFNENLIEGEYIVVLKKELEQNPNNNIYLITSRNYINFTITIYPLDIEDFVYEQVLLTNNLLSANFTKLYENFIEYEVNTGELLLVCLLQYYTTNSPINYVYYYLYSLDENTFTGQIIDSRNSRGLKQSSNKIYISYPLSNYVNKESSLSKRNKEYLVDNIKKMNEEYPEIDLSNINDPFYNDICYLFTSDVDTDMTLNDRRKEYFISASLCENNCKIITILKKEIKTPRSLCSCNLKTELNLDNFAGVADNIPSISSYNGKAVSCISETFNKNFLSSNIIFWIFLLVFLFLISMIIAWILYGKKEIKKILGIYNVNPDESNSEISIDSNDNEKGLSKNNVNKSKKGNNKKNKDKKNSQNDQKKGISKSMNVPEKKDENYLNNQIDSQQADHLSAPINPAVPPKRKESAVTKNDNSNKTDELISNSEPSLFKASIIKPNEKDNITDISFENIPNEDKIYVDNLLKERYMLNNNYLRNPIDYENFLRIQIIRNALTPLDKEDQIIYCNSCEDIFVPKNNNNGNKNNKKSRKKVGKNDKIQQFLLDGESLYDDEENDSNYNYNNNLSDNFDEQKNEKNKNIKVNNNNNTALNKNPFFQEEKGFEGDEQFIFPGGVLGKNGENILHDKIYKNSILKKNKKNKNSKKGKGKNNNNLEDDKNNESNDIDDEDDEDDYNIENNIIKIKKNKSNKSKNNSRKVSAKNRLLKSIGKNNNDSYDKEEEKDGREENKKNEKLKTEYENNAKSKIKSELKKIANDEDDEISSGGIFKRKGNKGGSLISNDSDTNNLIKSQNPNLLKLKTNSKNYYSRENNKNNSKGNDKFNRNSSAKEKNRNNKNSTYEKNGNNKNSTNEKNRNNKNGSFENSIDNKNNTFEKNRNNKNGTYEKNRNNKNGTYEKNRNNKNDSFENSVDNKNGTFENNRNDKNGTYEKNRNSKNGSVENNKDNKIGSFDNNKDNKNSSSNRNMLDFQEEGEMNGDKGIPIKGEIILKNKNKTKNFNNKNNSDDNNMSDMISNDKASKNSKSDIEFFQNKILASSFSAFLQTDGDQPISVEEQFLLFYWRYLNKRELGLVSFRDKKKTIPYFVRWSGFTFCLIFIYLLSSVFFFEKYVHKRYLNALKGNKNSVGFYFKNEFVSSFYVSLISIIIKILFIKFVFIKLYKINKEDKKMMSHAAEKELDKAQLEELQDKRSKFLIIYKLKLIIFFASLMALSILFAYICICYAGVFRNSISYFILGFILSCIFSFIFCAFFCFIIVGTLWLGKKYKNKCLLSTYYVLSTIY